MKTTEEKYIQKFVGDNNEGKGERVQVSRTVDNIKYYHMTTSFESI